MITLIMDLQNKCWHVTGEADSTDVTLEFYLDMDPIHTPFKNFGHEFSLQGMGSDQLDEINGRVTLESDNLNYEDNEEAISETVFPFLVERHFVKNLYPDEEYTLQLMFKNRREVIESTFTFKTPKPEKPFDSWVWDNSLKEWTAPVTPPSLVWDEVSQQWIIP